MGSLGQGQNINQTFGGLKVRVLSAREKFRKGDGEARAHSERSKFSELSSSFFVDVHNMKYDLSDKKAAIFDFDGVILDSENYKMDAHVALFSDHPKVNEIKEYIYSSAGINRYHKYRHIHENILQTDYTPEIEKELSDRYDAATFEGLKELPLIEGVEDYLKILNIPRYIASSTPQHALDKIVDVRNLRSYFTGIYGNPTLKNNVVEMAMEDLNLKPEQIVFFGDTMTDFRAAEATGAHFIAVASDPSKFPKGTRSVESFKDLI